MPPGGRPGPSGPPPARDKKNKNHKIKHKTNNKKKTQHKKPPQIHTSPARNCRRRSRSPACLRPSWPIDDPAERRASEIRKIQKDIPPPPPPPAAAAAKLAALFTRLAVFVGAADADDRLVFLRAGDADVRHQIRIRDRTAGKRRARRRSAGLMQGNRAGDPSAMPAAPQSYLMSREAMIRLDEELGFVAHFQNPEIDAIQRLPEERDLFETPSGIYQDRVKIGTTRPKAS